MEPGEESTLLPRFKPSAFDSIPIYDIVLDTYDLVSARVDTSLKYDQLRSPQVHSFLIKPLVTDLREKMSLGTLYALMANMIQFGKESDSYAAMAGIMTTRAMICEIVAIKLLKDYDDDDLMNALTYDFYPLARGDISTATAAASSSSSSLIPRWQRLSTLELAIKAEAKRFLAHPVVIQILEEIWNGSIMFQTSMHKLHRVKFANEAEVVASEFGRRGAGIRYKYEEASILKLSRLRVPRYRHLLNLGSFCVLLGLYLQVLSSPTMEISTREIMFGLWSLGFILDEIIGFTDVGFTLYVLSLWNLFDLMILLQILSYAVCRIMAIRLNNIDNQQQAAKSMLTISYDILATIAIFLFPRLFSIFDNYESFSRMVIAVRKMSIDLAVSWLVIVMLSSGFWIAFTMAFARDVFSANQVAYDLMRILFGFTPVVWENWKYYSPIGRLILLFYLFITHFVVMTLLFAVLSNSFSSINENSHEEHQYLFAVNTISMIKSESSSLFSYSPPLNLIEWAIRPFFYVLPLRTFLILNRTIVKITHFPVLYSIFVYERLYLRFVQVKDRISRDSQNDYRKKQEERLRSLASQLASTPGQRKTRKRGTAGGGGSGIATPGTPGEIRRKNQLNSKKISKYDLLDEVFKRPYKGTIKVKPTGSINNNNSSETNYETINRVNSINRSHNENSHNMNRDTAAARLLQYRRGSSRTSSRPDRNEIYSDPEDTMSRNYYYSSQAGDGDSDIFDDDEDVAFLAVRPTIRQRHPSTVTVGDINNSHNNYNDTHNNRTSTVLQTVPSSVAMENFFDNTIVHGNRGIGAAVNRSPLVIRNRLFSSTSSLLRNEDTTAMLLSLSPTRSTSSILRRRNPRIDQVVRRRKAGVGQPGLDILDNNRRTRHHDVDEEGVDDEEEEGDEYGRINIDDQNDADYERDDEEDIMMMETSFNRGHSDALRMQREIMTRIDNLESVFKNIESQLTQLNSKSSNNS